MWDLLQKILESKISPNACLFLFSVRENVQCPFIKHEDCIHELIDAEFITYDLNDQGRVITITDKGMAFIYQLDNYFVKAKKKTNIQLMGKEFLENIEKYRDTFPKGKLPSGYPARNNIKALGESFRWFFETFDYTWSEIHKATEMYVNEYRDNNYLYMMTSQYFISKQDKNKVKKSTLADYCDMVRDGVTTEEPKFFKDKVV
jgi:predicted transcriptional regulator